MENENENLNSENEEFDIKDIETIDDVDALKNKIKTFAEKGNKVVGANKQLFVRTKKAEGFELKDGKWIKPEPPKVENLPKIVEEPKAPSQSDPRDIVRLTKALSGFNDEEVSFIYRNAKSQKLDDIIEATKDPWVSSAIESQRIKVAQEKKVLEPGVVPGGLSKTEISVDDIAKDPSVHKKAFDKLFETEGSGI
jgi:ATP-dependent exoDNAse (exonuclease V) alpha subunit